VVVTVFAYFVPSLIFAPADAVDSDGVGLPYNVTSERGTITLLSSGMFCIAACLAARAWATVRASPEPRADPVGGVHPRHDVADLAAITLKVADALFVLLVGRPVVRLPVNWLAALAAAGIVLRAVPWLEGDTRPRQG